ncbi:ADP-ribosylglycohydrolase family protein [Curtobacterium sp. MCBD17_013]|uniref:ADP-ribosylglycohydrolase family protein n=1 Tax=unclassified Curtobacterium TaxID=257496 RepID=UPI000DA8F8FF|nr:MULTISPECIES: ADP-ribosylglycohydrolase family protein [unclassified Curtobacterium]PZF66162.1 ADP-ribosylglycohydrolase family protein [Curtobacterium sp. MCBD17_013]WIB64699.1 ADP-ribosylglycohydrolase family protein [Curtobacterium sp. MCBD17_040]
MDDDVRDRALGSVLAAACGDALGAGYEFGPPLAQDAPVRMRGGGPTGTAPGEWTDDTAMGIPVLEALARGDRLDDARTLGRIVAEWADWAQDAPDAGVQTRAVFAELDANTEAAARAAALAVHQANGRSAGNGSLMRTGPVALAYLGDGTKRGLAAAARRVSELTHHEDDAGDACVLWTAAIRRAVRKGHVDVRTGIPLLPRARRARWLALLDEAEQSNPADFADRNGWVVAALQGAVSAVTRGSDLVDVLERAVRGGNDTDTVAAIAGSLAGARYGAGALPDEWLAVVHGWPGKRIDWLRTLTARALATTH